MVKDIFNIVIRHIVRLILPLALISSVSLAQNSNNTESKSELDTASNYTDEYKGLIRVVISENIDDVATKALARFYPKKYFRVESDIVIENYPDKLPYTSNIAFLTTLKYLQIVNLRKYLTNVNVKIFLSERINVDSQDQISAIIRKSLMLSKTDTTSFEILKLSFESEDDALRSELAKLDGELKARNEEIGTLIRERNDITLQNTTNKTNLEAELAKNVELENQLSSTRSKLSKTEGDLEDARRDATNFLDHPRITIILALVGGGLCLFGIVFFFALRGLANAFTKVAESVGDIGSAIPELARNSGLDASAGSEALDGASMPQHALPGAVGESSDMNSVAELQNKVIEVQENILGRLDESNLQSVITHISSLLSESGTFETGIASMELLGPDIANRIFSLLGENQKKPIRKFLTSSTYSQPKTIALYNAGHSLMTFLSMETMSSNFANKSPHVSLVISKLELEDQVQLAHKLSENGLSRLMLYIKPEVIVEITKYCETASPEQADKCLKAISKISQSVEDAALDEEIIATTEELLADIQEDSHRKYMQLYVAIGNQLSDSMSSKLKNIMASSSEKLGVYLEKEILNVASFYLLSKDTQAEVLSTLSNKDIAAITVDMEEDESSNWTSKLSKRRKSLFTRWWPLSKLKPQLKSVGKLKMEGNLLKMFLLDLGFKSNLFLRTK